LVNGVIKTVAKLFSPAPNSRYKSRQLATVLVDLGRRKASAEEYFKPSPDRILDRLHEVDEKSFNSAIWELNTDLLKRLPLPHKVTLALDYKTLPYYGEEQPALVSDSRLPGTRLGIRFAMLSIVESGRTFALAIFPFSSITVTTSCTWRSTPPTWPCFSTPPLSIAWEVELVKLKRETNIPSEFFLLFSVMRQSYLSQTPFYFALLSKFVRNLILWVCGKRNRSRFCLDSRGW
jgi:hypothetical protein